MQDQYPCVATSASAFVRQLAASYLPHGYKFYVCGYVPDRFVDRAEDLDHRMIDKYDVNLSKATRSKRRSEGTASVRYIRFGRFWLLLSTRGRHRFFEQHRQVYDFGRNPVLFHGYEIRLVEGRPRVRIERQEYRRLNGYLVDVCTRPKYRPVDQMAQVMRRSVNLDPYREVIAQYVRIIRQVNRRRRSHGLLPVPLGSVKLRNRRMYGPRLIAPTVKLEGHPGLETAKSGQSHG